MAKSRSPFLVIPDFVSPLTCEEIVDKIALSYPDVDADTGRPLMSYMGNALAELSLHDYLEEATELTEEYYGTSIKGVHRLEFQYYPQGVASSKPVCENSVFNGKWTRANNKDFVGILFLTDYQERVPFDPMFEVKGGKLQFPTHGFGFNPKRGMLVIFPGDEHFVYSTSAIQAGELFQVKICMTAEENYVYNPRSFPGNYEVWFG